MGRDRRSQAASRTPCRHSIVCCMPMLPAQVAPPSCRTLCPAALPLPVLSLSTVSLMRHSGCSDTYMAQHGGGRQRGRSAQKGSVGQSFAQQCICRKLLNHAHQQA